MKDKNIVSDVRKFIENTRNTVLQNLFNCERTEFAIELELIGNALRS